MTDSRHQGFVNSRVLRFNVGFLLAESAGYYRVTEVDLPRVRVADDLTLDYLRGSLRMSRNSRGLLIQGVLEASVLSECVRCLTPTFVPVSLEIRREGE